MIKKSEILEMIASVTGWEWVTNARERLDEMFTCGYVTCGPIILILQFFFFSMKPKIPMPCLNLIRWNEGFIETLRKSRIETTKTLAQKIAQSSNPPEVFVSTSAVGKLSISSVSVTNVCYYCPWVDIILVSGLFYILFIGIEIKILIIIIKFKVKIN